MRPEPVALGVEDADSHGDQEVPTVEYQNRASVGGSSCSTVAHGERPRSRELILLDSK